MQAAGWHQKAAKGVDVLIQLADRRELTEENWRELRRGGIGGSDAAAIMGLSPYSSPLSVYYEKVHGPRQQQASLPMELGRELEPFLRRKFGEWLLEEENCEVQVREEHFMLGSEQHSFMYANLDGGFYHPQLGPCGLELKTTGELAARSAARREENNWLPGSGGERELSKHCYIQVQHYMAVTGLEHFYVAVLVGNRHFGARLVSRNEEVIRNLVRREEAFWQEHVLPEIPPEPRGLACDSEALKSLYPAGEEENTTIELQHCQEQFERYRELKRREKGLQQELEALRQGFMAEMGRARVGLLRGGKITWKTVERQAYTVPAGSYRTLRIG